MHIRAASADDALAIAELWRVGGMLHDTATDRVEIDRILDHDPSLVLVGEIDATMVASVIGTFDGHRGRIKRCIVHPGHRSQGLGAKLIAALEQRFRERNITELRLEVWSDNTGAADFWTGLGWNHEPDISYFTRSLTGSDGRC